MIPVIPQSEPAEFDHKVRKPGLQALQELLGDPTARPRPGPRREKVAERLEDIPSARLEPYWQDWCLDALYRAYKGVCAYTCLQIELGTGGRTVDHYIPRRGGAAYAYEWSNYRLACALVNTHKGDAQAAEVLDPFEVHDEWFELDLVDFHVKPMPGLEAMLRARIVQTIERLHLQDPCFRARHEADFVYYMAGEISFSYLERRNPLLARELKRKGRLRAE